MASTVLEELFQVLGTVQGDELAVVRKFTITIRQVWVI
jgi:hypothetical protein